MGKTAETKTFDELYYAMVFMAEKFRKSHPEYQIGELVNEIWLSPQFKNMPHSGCIWKACWWAMMAYHRKQIKVDRHRWRVYFHPMPEEIEDDYSDILVRDDPSFEAVDIVDMIEHLPQRDRELILARLQGRFDKEIAKELGVTAERVRQRRKQLRQKVA